MEVKAPELELNLVSLPNLTCKVSEFGMYMHPTRCDLNDFWDGCKDWLVQRGIHLYEQCHSATQRTFEPKNWLCPPATESAPLPYSAAVKQPRAGPHYMPLLMRLACAQDSIQRDLILKLVDKNSVEHRVYQRIEQHLPTINDNTMTFPCVLPPVAILDTPHEFALITMPMWGSPINLEGLRTVREVLCFIECLLRGVAFLHRLRIAHRDICDHNIVINCHSPGVIGQDFRELQLQHLDRGSDRVLYALIDYDQSMQFPEDVSLERCLRPSAESAAGADRYKPSDTDLGEPYYNPFAFDVGMAGMMFRHYFTEAVPQLPGLAALFDKMTDHSIRRRHTAEEALLFFTKLKEHFPWDTMDATVALQRSYAAMEDASLYWSKLPPDDQHLWGRYRTPPRPLLGRVLNWITSRPMGWKIVHFVRRILQI